LLRLFDHRRRRHEIFGDVGDVDAANQKSLKSFEPDERSVGTPVGFVLLLCVACAMTTVDIVEAPGILG
jgi:hypothetical protein